MIERQSPAPKPSDPRVVSRMESVAPDNGERDKQQEVMNRVLASSLVSQMLRSGCHAGQVIDFAAEILNNVTQNGFNNGHEADDPITEDAQEILWRVEQADGENLARIVGPRVTLLPLAKNHLVYLKKWQQDRRIQRTCSHERLKEIIAQFRKPTQERYDLVICDENETPIGLVSLFDICRIVGQGELAKLLGNPDALGAGYAREASALLLAFAFERLGLERIYLRTKGFNLHNIKLNERLGFRFEGILRSSYRLNGELIDVVLMSMLSTEYYRKYGTRELPASVAT